MESALKLFAKAGDGVFAVDLNQRILYWNDLAAHTLGYSASETIGRYCWQILEGKSPDNVPICRPDCPIIQKLRQNLPVEPFNLVVKHHNGRSVKVNVSSIGLPENGEGFAGLVHLQREVEGFS
jgi:PAS domain S-box-containing protein